MIVILFVVIMTWNVDVNAVYTLETGRREHNLRLSQIVKTLTLLSVVSPQCQASAETLGDKTIADIVRLFFHRQCETTPTSTKYSAIDL